ncbi:DUF6249 domain-containing protein [Asticcacaulis currens]
MEGVQGILAILMVFGMPVFIVGIVMFFRARERAETQKTIRMAIEKGQALPPEYLDSLKRSGSGRIKTPVNDIRSGLILMAVALGLVVMDYVRNDYTFETLSGIAAIPGFIGVALLIMGIVGLNTQKKS